ncbi:MAG: aminotransferase class V-fold PLP-dependent enzyme [Actinomycetia bacterium]|nr:aminotransferase class V-fold PLP-dependent enzyme [Actinomycetes bacterium]
MSDGARPSRDGAPDFDLRAEGAAALDWVARYLERVPELPVLAQVDSGEIRGQLPAAPPEEPEPFSAVLRDLDELLMPGLTHWQHPRFFSYFSVTSSEPAILAELIAAALNQVAFIWRTSPAATELELHMLSWLAQLLGLPDGWHGHLEDTASTSTLAALVAARHRTSRPAIVCSEHAHSSVEKAARMLQLELRPIETDTEFRMRSELAAAQLRRGDVAAVVATVGTTSAAAVDPVPELARLCEQTGTWLHVDAAYAGAAWVCDEFRWSQAGAAGADSLVVNPHKWLFVPVDCSALWTREPDVFREAFRLVPDYLRAEEEAENLSDYGPALGRRFRALKLWTVLRCFGQQGIQERIREAVQLATLFEEWVRADADWELAAPRHFSLVCFRHRGGEAENLRILEAVNASGEVFISHTVLGGQVTLRLAVGNARTSQDDVARAWQALRSAAGRSRLSGRGSRDGG